MCTLEKRGNLFILTLTGEDDHRLGLPLISTLRATLNQIRTEAKPGSVLITTAQGKFFSNGFDLAYAADKNGSINIPRLREMVDGFKPVISDFLTLPLPTIAVVSGHAAAAGFMLALVHDYVLMRKDRGVLYMSEVNIGLTFPDYFMALMKSKITSPIARRDVVLRAAKLTAEKAVEYGIIDSAHENLEETMKAGLKLGEELGSKKWKGEIYADIRMNSYSEISELLGLVEDFKSVIPAKL
ncbi:hypothetical protein MKW92_006710 [Papaver armeniacum]|nr:hypothetical protein MKW92_015706 [Papaver armeniacum]KAI3944508.1 hypothetical protein MKW92_006710 [Papaver armeniacum]